MDYVDANIIIYAFLDEGAKSEACKRLLTDADLVTSSLSLDEVAYKLFKKVSPAFASTALKILLSSPRLAIVPFQHEHFSVFTELVESGIYPRDAVHAATALKSNCKFIYSEDGDFDRLSIPRKTPW
ncbi:TPA: PIN domain-containing protein [Candidatus Micrarchaeota archaeon]|nr:PIN domain-containing protein [Candidatus Micrarchaeota archaeon]